MSTEKCIIVIAGILQDRTFNHVRFIAESLSTLLPNFNYNVICKDSTEWKSWLEQTCMCCGWNHTESPLIWKEIGLTRTSSTYIGGAYQFWELLHKYYNITSHLNRDDLEALQEDFAFVIKCDTCQERRKIMIIGAGRSMCHNLVPQLIMTKEIWLSHGLVIKLYDEPGCYFKVRKILEDAKGLVGGLDAVQVVYDIPDGLHDCEVLIYIDALIKEEFEGTESWLHRNYKSAKELSMQINNHAPSHMKILFCSLGPTCFFVNVMHRFVTNLPKTSIVAVGSHYGLEVIYVLARSTGFPLKNFGCPPVWGYLGINQFVDVHHMIQKSDYYLPNRRALDSSDTAALPIGVQRSQLRWFFYMVHDKIDHYKEIFARKSLTQYQVGRCEDFQKCRAICDLLKLWYRAEVGDEILSLGVISDGSFGIPEGLVFSQPVYLKVLEDQSRVWVPFKDFPMPNMPLGIFQNLVDTAVMINKKFPIVESKMEDLNTGNYKEILTQRNSK
ncbi:putative malate dehydrogenase 1B [Halictus rubicundus]|uniref:putative malate dehydrogenase 1B n=1 Tax=Halictus rubicundus TaxID=77578 RepID=UPI004035D859